MELISVSNLFAYGCTKCSHNWSVSENFSTFHRLYFVISGEACFKTETQKIKLKANTLYLFPLYQKYEIQHNPCDPLQCLWFHISLNTIRLNDLVLSCTANNSMLTNILAVLDELNEEKASSSIVKSTLNSLFAIWSLELAEHMCKLDGRLETVLAYIHQHFSDVRLDNKTLAQLVQLDTRYFIRLFKNNLNQTPHAYISNYRAYQSINLLLNGKRVYEAAYMVGFSNEKAFSRFFKNHYGVSPSKISKSYFLQP